VLLFEIFLKQIDNVLRDMELSIRCFAGSTPRQGFCFYSGRETGRRFTYNCVERRWRLQNGRKRNGILTCGYRGQSATPAFISGISLAGHGRIMSFGEAWRMKQQKCRKRRFCTFSMMRRGKYDGAETENAALGRRSVERVADNAGTEIPTSRPSVSEQDEIAANCHPSRTVPAFSAGALCSISATAIGALSIGNLEVAERVVT